MIGLAPNHFHTDETKKNAKKRRKTNKLKETKMKKKIICPKCFGSIPAADCYSCRADERMRMRKKKNVYFLVVIIPHNEATATKQRKTKKNGKKRK